MTSAALHHVGTAVAEKARGETPGRLRAFAAAVVAGGAAAVLTYRVLRGTPFGGDDG